MVHGEQVNHLQATFLQTPRSLRGLVMESYKLRKDSLIDSPSETYLQLQLNENVDKVTFKVQRRDLYYSDTYFKK